MFMQVIVLRNELYCPEISLSCQILFVYNNFRTIFFCFFCDEELWKRWIWIKYIVHDGWLTCILFRCNCTSSGMHFLWFGEKWKCTYVSRKDMHFNWSSIPDLIQMEAMFFITDLDWIFIVLCCSVTSNHIVNWTESWVGEFVSLVCSFPPYLWLRQVMCEVWIA